MIPYLQNCSHSPDGWCLKCVKELAIEKEKIAKNCEVLMSMLSSAEKKLKQIKAEKDGECWWF